MPKPDFFIVGAPKCGTTALTEYLRRHPEIFIPEGKEFHYFGEDLQFDDAWQYVRDEASYLDLFESAEDSQRVGESSVLYLYSKSAPREMKSFQADAKIIIALRNPVDMMYSEHRQLVYAGSEPEADFETALETRQRESENKNFPEDFSLPGEISYHELATPAEDVARYFEVLGRENVHVILFEEFFASPETHYRALLEFLGVDATYQPEFDRVNPNTVERFPGLNRWLRDPDRWPGRWIKTVLDWIGPKQRQRLLSIYKWINTRREDRDELDDDLRERLLEDLREEVRELEAVLDRDLSMWFA